MNVRTGGSYLNSVVKNAYVIFLIRFSQYGEAADNYVLLTTQIKLRSYLNKKVAAPGSENRD